MRRVAVLLALLTLAGCGGNAKGLSGSYSASSTKVGKGKGKAVLRIKWPVRSTTRLIPNTSNEITVSLMQGTTVIATAKIPRPANGATSTSTKLTGLAYGTYTVSVQAHPNADGSGIAQASGGGSMTVTEDVPGSLSVSMDSTVATLSLAALPPSTVVGGTTTLTASAKDAGGSIVLLATGSLQESLTWASDTPSVATVSDVGPTATLTGVSLGTTTVTARLKIKDDGTTCEATLPVNVVPGVVASGLATGGWPTVGGGYGRTFAGHVSAVATPGTPVLLSRGSAHVIVGPDGILYTGSTTGVVAQGGANWTAPNDNLNSFAIPNLVLTQTGVLLIGTDQGLYARDARNGALLWSFGAGSGAVSVARDGTVYAGSGRSSLAALDGATGAVRWTASGVSVDAIGDDGTLYGKATVTTGSLQNATFSYYVRAYDPCSGAQRWSTLVGTRYSTSDTTLSFSELSVTGTAVYFKTSKVLQSSGKYYTNTQVRALSSATGGSLWTYDFPTYNGNIRGGAGNRVAARGGRVFTQWKGRALAFDATTGAKQWDVAGGYSETTATGSDGTVYCGLGESLDSPSMQCALLALDPATGATRWKVVLADGGGVGDLALADDGTAYVPTSSGVFSVH